MLPGKADRAGRAGNGRAKSQTEIMRTSTAFQPCPVSLPSCVAVLQKMIDGKLRLGEEEATLSLVDYSQETKRGGALCDRTTWDILQFRAGMRSDCDAGRQRGRGYIEGLQTLSLAAIAKA